MRRTNRRRTFIVLSSLCASISSMPEVSQAQTTVPAATDVMDRADQLYNAGLAAAEKERWAEAVELFRAAWELDKKVQSLGALGQAELKSKRFLDAAQHLEAALRTGQTSLGAGDKKALDGWLKEARERVVMLTIRVDIAGAELLVDDRAVGTSPLDHPIFAPPGLRRFEARRAGYKPARSSIQADAGRAYDVSLPMIALESGTSPGEGLNKKTRGWTALSILGLAGGGALVASGTVMAGIAASKGAEKSELAAKVDGYGFTGSNACKPSQDLSGPNDVVAESVCKDAAKAYVLQKEYGLHAAWMISTGALVVGSAFAHRFWWSKADQRIGVLPMPVVSAQGGGVLLLGSW